MIGKRKHKPVDRYEPPKITKKANKAPAVAKVNERQYVAALQEIPIKSLTRNKNPLKKLERIDKPLTIKQDQQEKQVIKTIREVPCEMYTPAHLLIPPQDKLSVIQKTYSKTTRNRRFAQRLAQTHVTQSYGQFRYKRSD